MKPQLVALETQGAHNADLEGSRTRIMEGGSWKRQRVVFLIPAGQTIPTKVYLSHCALIFPPNQSAYRMAAIGMEVGEAYSNAIAEIIAHPDLGNWEFIFTAEHDNIIPSDAIIRLIARMEAHPELSAISGSYWTKGVSGINQRWGDVNDPIMNFRPQPPPQPGELGECCGLGMGACLFRLSMFKDARLKRPWFRTIAGPEGVGTQDLAFWADARKYGYRAAVDGDVRVGHYDMEGKFGPPDMVW